MIGILSFLSLVAAVAFVAAVVLLVVRSVKRQPRKPFVILAVVSAVAFLGLCVWVSDIYVPAEKPQDTVAEAEPPSVPEPENPTETEPPSVPEQEASAESSDSTVENVDSGVDKSTNVPVESSANSAQEHSDAPEESSPVETEPPSVPETTAPSLAETYKTDVVVASKMLLDRFITDYSVSLAPQLWTVADFDSEGAVIALADVTFKSSGAVERALLVLSPVIENGKMTEATPHYVAVGETVYGDDGYCDEVFSNLQEAFDAFAVSDYQ